MRRAIDRSSCAWTLAMICTAMLALGGCKKKTETPAAPAGGTGGGSAATKGSEPPATKTAPAAAPAAELVEQTLPRTKLKIKLPKGAKVSEAIIAGADQINFPGISSAFIVKPRLLVDKTLDKLEPWAKGHQIQKFKREVLKTGSGKTYTYMYAVDLGGNPQVVYHQMFQVGGKDYVCFSNAPDEKAAKAFKTSCDTIAK